MLIPEELRLSTWKLGKEIEIEEPFKILQPESLKSETHEKVTNKIYHAFISIFNRYPNFDWYYLVDDDSYVNVKNLRLFLNTKNPAEKVTFGYNLKGGAPKGYHSGGPGYVISNSAFSTLCNRLNREFSSCPDTGVDDIDVNHCLQKDGTEMADSRDHLNRHRFLIFNMAYHFNPTFHEWLWPHTLYPLNKGYDCCSDSLITVHYVRPRELIRLDIIIEILETMSRRYKDLTFVEKNVTFKDIYDSFMNFDEFLKRWNSTWRDMWK